MPLEGPTPRRRPERTGKHYCAKCLAEITGDEFFAGDFYCRECAANDTAFPLATTPDDPSGSSNPKK